MVRYWDFKKDDAQGYTATKIIYGLRPTIKFAVEHFSGKKGLSCLEIGVQGGANSDNIVQLLDPAKITLVGIWEQFFVNGQDAYPDYKNSFKMSLNYVTLNWSNLGVHVYKGKSQDILPLFEADSFDFVYIDGDHEASVCEEDIRNSLRVCKIGGIVGGHDYCHVPYQQLIPEMNEVLDEVLINVSKAVHTVFQGKVISVETGDWWVIVTKEMKELGI